MIGYICKKNLYYRCILAKSIFHYLFSFLCQIIPSFFWVKSFPLNGSLGLGNELRGFLKLK